MPKKTVTLLLAVLIAASLILSACGGGAPTQTSGAKGEATSTAPAGSEAYPPATAPTAAATSGTSGSEAYPAGGSPTEVVLQPIEITKPDGSSVTLSDTDLQKVPVVQINAGDQIVMGYSLPELLSAAGITDYQQVTFTGASNSLTLTKDKVSNTTVILRTKEGKLRVASSDVPNNQWVSDITKIEVK